MKMFPIILLIGVIGLALALQGWKARTLTFDMLPYVDSIEQLRESGSLPRSGTLTSFASYTPPGTAWLMLPGMLAFHDPRLFESIGSAVLYLGTLIGIFLLTRACLGKSCAVLATTLWGISASGLFFAHSLWPRGHPFFFVWMVYWTVQWVKKDNAYFLGAAILTWALGMYVFMEIAPAIFFLPVAWLLYRPALHVKPILLAATLSAIVWYPYLRFESGRNFIDLKSQIQRHQIYPPNYHETWCDPGLATGTWQPAVNHGPGAGEENGTDKQGLTAVKLFARAAGRANLILSRLLLSNFQYLAIIPGSGIVLFAMTLIGLTTLLVSSLKRPGNSAENGLWILRFKWIGISAVAAGILFNERILRYVSPHGSLDASTVLRLRLCQTILLVVGVLLIAFRERLVAALVRLLPDNPRDAAGARLLALALIVPWVLLLVITDAERIERFWWLWPLQVIALASVVTYLPMKLKAPRWGTWAGSFLFIFLLAANTLAVSRLSGWLTDGWSGVDAPEIQLTDYIASLLKSRGNDHPSIGYELNVYKFMAVFHGTDPLYTIGADLDVEFKYRHGIVNSNKCAEGVSANDEYRVVRFFREGIDDLDAKYRIDTHRDSLFRMIREIGPYQVYQRP